MHWDCDGWGGLVNITNFILLQVHSSKSHKETKKYKVAGKQLTNRRRNPFHNLFYN